jgi:hypothetical protein
LKQPFSRFRKVPESGPIACRSPVGSSRPWVAEDSSATTYLDQFRMCPAEIRF